MKAVVKQMLSLREIFEVDSSKGSGAKVSHGYHSLQASRMLRCA